MRCERIGPRNREHELRPPPAGRLVCGTSSSGTSPRVRESQVTLGIGPAMTDAVFLGSDV